MTTSQDRFSELRFDVHHAPVAYRTPEGVRSDTKDVGKVAYRSDTGAAIALVGPRQTLVQPSVTIKLFEQLIDRGHVQADTVRCDAWKGGARIAIRAKTGRSGEVKTQRKVGSVVVHRMFFLDGFDGATSLRIGSQDEVLACTNGMTRIANVKATCLRHTLSLTERYIEVVRALRMEIDGFDAHVATLQTLADTRLNDSGFQALIGEWFPRGEHAIRRSRAQAQAEMVENLYYTGAGADPGSLWGAYQAATNWITHHRGYDSSREEQNLTGAGAALNLRILTNLSQRAQRARELV